jgi:hypothetical protein
VASKEITAGLRDGRQDTHGSVTIARTGATAFPIPAVARRATWSARCLKDHTLVCATASGTRRDHRGCLVPRPAPRERTEPCARSQPGKSSRCPTGLSARQNRGCTRPVQRRAVCRSRGQGGISTAAGAGRRSSRVTPKAVRRCVVVSALAQRFDKEDRSLHYCGGVDLDMQQEPTLRGSVLTWQGDRAHAPGAHCVAVGVLFPRSNSRCRRDLLHPLPPTQQECKRVT